MRTAVEIEQFFLGKEPAEMNLANNAEFFRQLLEVRLERPLAGDDQFGIRKFLLENCESAEGSRDTLLRDQPARLHETPAAVDRRIAANKWKFVERNTGAIDAEA